MKAIRASHKLSMKVAALLSLLFILAAVGALADVLLLRDGQRVEGQIIDQNNLKVVIRDERGTISRYFKDQIADILTGDIETPLMVDTSHFDNISQEKAGLIIRLIEANGTRKSLEANINGTIKSAPQNRRDELKKLFDINEIVTALIPIYDQYFSEEELMAIIEFYESPSGQKMMMVSPDLIREASQASLGYFQRKLSLQ